MCVYFQLYICKEGETRHSAGIWIHCQGLRDEWGLVFNKNCYEQRKSLTYRHLSPQVLPLLPAFPHFYLHVWGSCQPCCVGGWRGEILAVSWHKAGLTVTSLTGYDAMMSQRQTGMRSGLSASSSILSGPHLRSQWLPRSDLAESAEHSRGHQCGEVLRVPRSLLPSQRDVKQSDKVTKWNSQGFKHYCMGSKLHGRASALSGRGSKLGVWD